MERPVYYMGYSIWIQSPFQRGLKKVRKFFSSLESQEY